MGTINGDKESLFLSVTSETIILRRLYQSCFSIHIEAI